VRPHQGHKPYAEGFKQMPNCFVKWLSALLLISAAFWSIGWGDSWESIRTAGDKITSIRADFTQEKHMPILQKPLISKGMLYYQLPDSLRWEYTNPIRSILRQHDGTTRRFVQGQDGMIEETGRQLEMMQFMLREIPLWLGGRFNENPLFSAVLQEGGLIEMRPTEAAMARIIERVQVQLSPTPGVIESVTVFEGREVFTRFLFTNVKLNESLEDSLFRAVD
jgi:hypothetical protein